MRRALMTLFVTFALVTACGDDDTAAEDTAADDTSTTTVDTSTTSTTTDDATSTSPSSSSSTTTAAPGGLPGERIEIFPYEDASLGVVGVAADDVLNVRSGPGVGFEVIAELEPLATGVIATGHNRSLAGGGFWSEIVVAGGTGWANVAFLSHLGQVDDITTEIAPTPADRPTAESMLRLGRRVAEGRASEEPESDVVVVAGPTVGDLGEITVDVIGLGDDAVGGERLHIFGQADSGGDRFTLRTVERTLLCTRGVSGDGLCL